MQWQTHTHTHSDTRDTQSGWSLAQGSDGILTHESVAHPQIKSKVSEHREYVVGVGEAGNIKHTHSHTHSVPRDTQGGWNLGQGSNATLTHVSVAAPLIKLMGNDHREEGVGVGGGMQCQTNTHKHTHTVSTVIHRTD